MSILPTESKIPFELNPFTSFFTVGDRCTTTFLGRLDVLWVLTDTSEQTMLSSSAEQLIEMTFTVTN